ncbi:MAG: hypothetical protein U1C55_04470 [Smithellaceae bacterium]|nr:hypothetical protein [Smithellaceae bacterium]
MLFRLIVAVVIVFVLYRVGRWFIAHLNQKNIRSAKSPQTIAREDLVEDPNCGTYIPLSSAYRETLSGEDVYFCSAKCRDEYRRKHR